MRTVSSVVSEIIQRSPFLAEVVAEGLSNNAELARKIKPDVEKTLLEEVSLDSIAMALHRISRQARTPLFGTRFLNKMSDITVRSNLIQFVFPNLIDLSPALGKAAGHGGEKKNIFLNFSRGLHESLLVISAELENEVIGDLKSKALKRISGLSAITMRLPEESLNIPGLYYPILKAIALEGISLVEVMSIGTEFTTIFADKDIDRAFSVVKKITS